ncbi:unnamed protein product [Rotaria sp. Silwood1]|nr:unnamed protein product [Rotaria sp. Silwood1]
MSQQVPTRKYSVEIKKQSTDYNQLVEYAVRDCISVTKLSIAVRQRWSRALLEKYSYTKSIRTNYNKVNDDQCCSKQQTSSDEVISSQQINNNNNDRTYTFEDYEPISDDDINNTINATIVIPVSKSTNDEPGTKIRHVIKVEHEKKRSHEAIRRCCRKRNAIIHAHGHDFDIIHTVYRCFTIREIENILDHVHIRRHHCHIHHHYKLHIGVRSYEDKLRYENVLNPEYFTKEHYIRQLHYISPFSHNNPDNVEESRTSYEHYSSFDCSTHQ